MNVSSYQSISDKTVFQSEGVPSVFMNVLSRNITHLTTSGKVYYCNNLIFIGFMQILIPNCGIEKILPSWFLLKSPNWIFMWCLRKWSAEKFKVERRAFITIISHQQPLGITYILSLTNSTLIWLPYVKKYILLITVFLTQMSVLIFTHHTSLLQRRMSNSSHGSKTIATGI